MCAHFTYGTLGKLLLESIKGQGYLLHRMFRIKGVDIKALLLYMFG